MTSRLLQFGGLVILLCLGCKNAEEKPEREPEIAEKHDFTLTFGSCSQLDLDQHLWDDLTTYNPEYWIWLGDIIYGDTEDMDVLANKYDRQNKLPEYRQFIDGRQVLGVWDDHDYGVNNGGKEYPKKADSRDLLFDFLGISAQDPDWLHEGAYNYRRITIIDFSIDIILLDVRYFRDRLDYDNGQPLPNTTGTILGKQQWAWLEDLVTSSTADLLVIGSGIQILHEDHKYEKWANFPNERSRLIRLIEESQKPAVLISGDRHIGEIAKLELSGSPFDLYEVTSSSLTHTWTSASEFNRYRQGPLVRVDNFGALDLDFSDDSVIVNLSLISEGLKIESEENMKLKR